jgi:hypothetical protein
MAKITAKFDDKQLRRNVRNFNRNVRRNLSVITDRRAAITTTDLKTQARWTDRTGAARSGLVAIPIHGRTYEEIFMAYSVTYGIWLEVAHDRKYAIITPMMRIAGEALLADMRYMLNEMSRRDFDR